MKQKPYVSIIIVCYNYGGFLPRTLDACLKQTFNNFEIVIVDNGSTDDTNIIIKKFKKDNSQKFKIKTVNIKKNNGLVKGRNAGLKVAKGKYLLFNDADDWMDSNCLYFLVKAAKKTSADRIIGSFRDIDVNGNQMQIRKFPKKPSKYLNTMLQASLYKRSIFIKNKIKFLEIGYDDATINLIFNIKSRKTIFVKKVIYNYFVNPNSTSGAKTLKNVSGKIIKIFNEYGNFAKNQFENVKTKDKNLIEYHLIKMYYFHILHECRYLKYKEIIDVYHKLNSILINISPNYINNKNIKLFKENGDRIYGRTIVWLMNKVEKLKLIRITLGCYLFISKFLYIPA